MSKRKKREMTSNAFDTEGTGKRKKLQQQGVKDTLEMFLRSEKFLYEPGLKQIYETMISREAQLAWLRFRLCEKIYSNETRDAIEMVLQEWKRHYYRVDYLQEYNIPNFIDRLTETEVKTYYNEIKNDYYLKVALQGYNNDQYRTFFNCEPFTKPGFDEHEQKITQALIKHRGWQCKMGYLESVYGKKSPLGTFIEAFEEWESDPEKQKKTKYETVFDFLVKQKKKHPLMDGTVREITGLEWEFAPKNLSLRALTSLLFVCYYQRDLLKANILKKILSLDLKSIGKDNVEEYLLPEVETIFLMADTTLPQVRINNNLLIKKIKNLFPGLWPY